MKVFLGGTCNESTWRDTLIGLLKIDYFNPVVDDWNEEAQAREIVERESCDYVLYTITPKMTGVYAIAEVVDDSNKRPDKTLFCIQYLDDGVIFQDGGKIRSLDAVADLVIRNGVQVFYHLSLVAAFLNQKQQ